VAPASNLNHPAFRVGEETFEGHISVDLQMSPILLRRGELLALRVDSIQLREGHPAVVKESLRRTLDQPQMSADDRC
jgi:hypothetical protein